MGAGEITRGALALGSPRRAISLSRMSPGARNSCFVTTGGIRDSFREVNALLYIGMVSEFEKRNTAHGRRGRLGVRYTTVLRRIVKRYCIVKSVMPIIKLSDKRDVIFAGRSVDDASAGTNEKCAV